MNCLCSEFSNEFADFNSLCIGQLEIFNNLSLQEISAVVNATFRKVYNEGEIIFSQGDRAEKMFLVKAGRIKLSKLTYEGDEIILDFRKSGDFLGEYILTETFEYPVTATCVERSLICGFTKNNFEKLVLEYPQIGLKVIKNLCKHIEILTAKQEVLAIKNIEDKLYNLLLNIARFHGKQSKEGIIIDIPLTHEELGFLIGAHRVSITRALKLLKDKKVIFQRNKKLIIST